MNVDRELNFPLCPNPECRIECRFMEGSSRTGSWIMCPNCEYCSSMAKDNATALRLHRAICGIARTQKCGPTVAEMPKLGEMLQNACDRFANGFADPEPKQDTGRDIADWICTGCGSTVDGHDVTYEEYHDPRAEGGCGGKVIPVPPPKQDAGREAVAWRLRGVWNDWLYFDSITEAEKHMISSDGPPTPLFLHPANDEACAHCGLRVETLARIHSLADGWDDTKNCHVAPWRQKNAEVFERCAAELREALYEVADFFGVNPTAEAMNNAAGVFSAKMLDQQPAQNDEAVRFPIGGYAPGSYQCVCCDCRMMFYGDKRSAQCLACAQGVAVLPFTTKESGK